MGDGLNVERLWILSSLIHLLDDLSPHVWAQLDDCGLRAQESDPGARGPTKASSIRRWIPMSLPPWSSRRRLTRRCLVLLLEIGASIWPSYHRLVRPLP